MEFKNLKVKSLSYGLALALATTPVVANASTFGTYYMEETETNYNTYKVVENDNASKISAKVVSYFMKKGEVPAEDVKMFKENADTKCRFWPAIVNTYLQTENKSKFRIHPGDVIKFPETYEELMLANIEAKKSAWYREYCSKEHYRNYVYIDKDEAYRMIKEAKRAMNEKDSIDDAYVEAYLKRIGGDSTKYIFKDGAKLFGDDAWAFYDYCPTSEEVRRDMNKNNTKTKTR